MLLERRHITKPVRVSTLPDLTAFGFYQSHHGKWHFNRVMSELTLMEHSYVVEQPYALLNVEDFTHGKVDVTHLSDTPPIASSAALNRGAYYTWEGRVRNLRKLLNGETPRATLYQEPGENPVYHRNLVGQVTSGSADSAAREYGSYPETSPPVFTLGSLNCVLTDTGSGSYLLENQTPVTLHAGASYDLIDSLPLLKDAVNSDTFNVDELGVYNPWYYPTLFGDFDYQIADDYLALRWGFIVGWVYGNNYYWSAIEQWFTYRWATNLYSPTVGVSFPWEYIVTCDVNFHETLAVNDAIVYYLDALPANGYRGVADAIGFVPTDMLSDDHLSWGSSYSPPSPIYSLVAPTDGPKFSVILKDAAYKHNFYAFNALVEDAIPSFTAGCFFSAGDAIDKAFGDLDLNMIENLVELPSIFDPVALVKELPKIVKKGPTPHIFTDVLGWLANANLAYSFGIAPTVGDAETLATKSSKTLAKLRNSGLYKPTTAYGSSVFVLEDGLKDGLFPGTVVTCRTKVRLGFNLDSFLPYIIPLRSVGLLPTPSALWDLVPYSWLIDWGLDVGSSLDIIETQLYLAAFDVMYTVNSIEVLYPFTTDETPLNFTVDNVGGTGFKTYVRYVLPDMPVMGPTSLPILNLPSVRDWDILGSVAFNRIR